MSLEIAIVYILYVVTGAATYYWGYREGRKDRRP